MYACITWSKTVQGKNGTKGWKGTAETWGEVNIQSIILAWKFLHGTVQYIVEIHSEIFFSNLLYATSIRQSLIMNSSVAASWAPLISPLKCSWEQSAGIGHGPATHTWRTWYPCLEDSRSVPGQLVSNTEGSLPTGETGKVGLFQETMVHWNCILLSSELTSFWTTTWSSTVASVFQPPHQRTHQMSVDNLLSN